MAKTIAQLKEENALLKEQLDLQKQVAKQAQQTASVSDNTEDKSSKFGKKLENAGFTHFGAVSKKGNHKAVFFKGEKSGRSFQLWFPVDKLPRMRQVATIREYCKAGDGVPSSVAVIVPLTGKGNVTQYKALK